MKWKLMALLMMGALAAEEVTEPAPEKVSSSLGYVDIGVGPLPVPLPYFGLGYRLQSDHNGMDLSLHAMTIVAITQLKATGLYQYYFKPSLNSQFYVGGGVGVSDIFNRKKHYFVISPEFVFGKQYRNEAQDTRFVQVGISWPTMNLSGHKQLGPDQEEKYPTISAMTEVAWKNPEAYIKYFESKSGLKIAQQIEQRCVKLVTHKDPKKLELALRELLLYIPSTQQFHADIQDMIKQLSAPAKPVKEGLIIQDTDQWEDMLLLGTEVSNSCQHLTGQVRYNKCLPAYMLDGKNRAMVVRNKEGEIIARAILRVLQDSASSEPVLFMERVYMRQDDPVLEKMVREGCLEKARQMDLCLCASGSEYPDLQENDSYPHPLKSLDSPAPFEYVDALGGAQPQGKFEISDSSVVFDPKA